MQKGQKSAFAHYEEDATGCQSKKIIEFELSIIVVFVVSRQKKARSPLFPHQLQSREPGSNIRTQNGIFRALWALVAFNWRGNGGGGVLSVWRERTKAK